MIKLTKEEIKAVRVLKKKNRSNREIAKVFGVSEGTIRYHQTRDDKSDGRTNKCQKAEVVAKEIDRYLTDKEPKDGRPVNIEQLYEYLSQNCNYQGSYKSVLRYVRKHYPTPRLRPHRRVETPPGIQAQADWGEFWLQIGRQNEKLFAFLLTLSHSRAFAVIWSKSENMLSWLNCHNQAFLKLRGIPYVVRIDNLKTGVASGAGATAVINQTYSRYAHDLRFVVDPCRAYKGSDKGKTEAKIKLLRYGLNPEAEHFASIEHLIAWTDIRVEKTFQTKKNPFTGRTIFESWQDEMPALQPLPKDLPAPFDVIAMRKVSRDCLINFEGRRYCVPFDLTGRNVEVRGGADTVAIYADGKERAVYPRGTLERLLIDQKHYDGSSTNRIIAPTPLGKFAKALVDLWDMPIERRPLDLYERLMAVKSR